jgi:hypothetical protein
MSWQIPTQVEQDIIAGKAKYQTFQTGAGGQSILQVPPNSYAVIFGYDFNPAGGGFNNLTQRATSTGVTLQQAALRPFMVQQLSFYTGVDFYPFIHTVNINSTITVLRTDTADPLTSNVTQYSELQEVDSTTISRQVYITSTNDVTITHGLIQNSPTATRNAIPVTNRTPQALTYGGSPQVVNTQTNFGPNATPLQFIQPSPKDFQDFGFGLLPGNADSQAFATPDVTNGLQDATNYINTIAPVFLDIASVHYYLCLHYALYSQTIPEQRG